MGAVDCGDEIPIRVGRDSIVQPQVEYSRMRSASYVSEVEFATEEVRLCNPEPLLEILKEQYCYTLSVPPRAPVTKAQH